MTLVGCNQSHQPTATTPVTGVVLSYDAPVVNARVRIQADSTSLVRTDENGEFRLSSFRPNGQTITAAAEGYIIGSVQAASPDSLPLKINLKRIPAEDNEAYPWVGPRVSSGESGACGNCHGPIVDEWDSSGHSTAATNSRFLNLYDGTDARGNPGHGWSLLADHPDAAGVCNSCHAPSAELDRLAVGDIRDIQGVAAEGVHCDFCHKIKDVRLDDVGLTHGVFGYELRRPESHDEQLFFGPLDDVDRGDDTYSSLQHKSEFCAPCHEGTVFGVPVYTTYSEWLASPAKVAGKQCQDCHMKPTGIRTNIAPDSGGLERDPMTLSSHSFLPGGRLSMLQQALKIERSWRSTEQGTHLRIQLTAKEVGHQIPTGFIDRNLILLVEAWDGNGGTTGVVKGPTIPEVAGPSYSGKAGKLFAKYLVDSQQNGGPIPFWQAAEDVVDSRLKPNRPEVFVFEVNKLTSLVRIRLIYRRFWETVSQEKQWPDDSIVVYDESLVIDANSG